MFSDKHSLDFLRGRVSVYYAGLDYRAFPFNKTNKRLSVGQTAHILYLKVLALLVDHVAIPPAFLVSGMSPSDPDEVFVRSLGDLFQSKTFVTAVHGTMNDPVDFYWYKLRAGDADERSIFQGREHQATTFFREVPLLHRDIPSMSGTFRDLSLEKLEAISDTTLPSEVKDRLRIEIQEAEAEGEVALSRMGFIAILDKLGLPRKQYLACYYAMNSAYYESGAATYHSDIACLSVEEFSVLGAHHFETQNHPIVVGYDPSLFYRVLRCHGVTSADIHGLTPYEIERLKADTRFKAFVLLYRDFVSLLQSAQDISNHWPKWKIIKFKEELLSEIETRFHAEQRMLANLVFGEDVGSGFFTALLGAVLGFTIAGPPGALVGAGVGFLGPLLKLGKFSVAEVIAKKLSQKQFSFFLYVEYLREKLARLSEEDEMLQQKNAPNRK